MNLREIDLRKVYSLWKSNLGCFRCFFRSTAIVSLQTYDDFTLYDYKDEVNYDVLNKVLKSYIDDSFMIIDLELNEILNLSLHLNNENNIKPILNVNLLFNNFGLIGNEKEISNLINCGLLLENKKSNRFVMMIPYDRYNDNIDVAKVYDKLNNQYEISLDDLPQIEFLNNLGYKSVTIITKNKIKDDLMEYINIIKNEIEVNIIKVDK